jgi:hypothetical protein
MPKSFLRKAEGTATIPGTFAEQVKVYEQENT